MFVKLIVLLSRNVKYYDIYNLLITLNNCHIRTMEIILIHITYKTLS